MHGLYKMLSTTENIKGEQDGVGSFWAVRNRNESIGLEIDSSTTVKKILSTELRKDTNIILFQERDHQIWVLDM